MAHFASAFACQCACDACSRFKIRQSYRNFKFAQIDGHHFLSYDHHQLSRPGLPGIDFHEDWSVSPRDMTYGQSVSNANNPDPYRTTAGVNFQTRIPTGLIGSAGTGYYVVTYNGGTNVSEITSFTPGDEMKVDYYFGANSQIFRNELTEAQHNVIMEADLADPRASFYRPNDGNKGDWYITEYNPAWRPNTLASGMFMGANAGGWLDVCDRNDLLARASTLNPDYYQHALRWSTGTDRYLQECIIYVPGDHSITEHEIRNDAFQSLNQTVISCRNITVPSGGSYTIAPPPTNNRAYIWHENGRC